MYTYSDFSPSLGRLNARWTLSVILITCASALSACSRMKMSNPMDQSTVGFGPVSVVIDFSQPNQQFHLGL
jgi:hypothetical protein